MGHRCSYFLGIVSQRILVSTMNLKLKLLWREIYHSKKLRGSHLPEQTTLPGLPFLIVKMFIESIQSELFKVLS